MSRISLTMMAILALCLAVGSCTSKPGLRFAEIPPPAPASQG
jgi:hypothetical protein